MKSVIVLSSLLALASAHATFQQLWINGQDMSTACTRLPRTNSPVENVLSNDIRCNASPSPASTTCTVPSGSTITVEMHQHASRDCSVEAIGGAHHGPVLLYLSSVPSAATADGSAPFFKIFESGLVNAATNTWGNDVLNQNCGKQSVTLPKNLPPGDYLLRAETIALHAAGQKGGAQFYMSCYQIRIEGGGGGKVPQGVSFPGAYKDTDEGILINIHYPKPTTYKIPGPPVATIGASAVLKTKRWVA